MRRSQAEVRFCSFSATLYHSRLPLNSELSCHVYLNSRELSNIQSCRYKILVNPPWERLIWNFYRLRFFCEMWVLRLNSLFTFVLHFEDLKRLPEPRATSMCFEECLRNPYITRYAALLCALFGKQRTLPRGVCCLVSNVKPVRQIALLLYGFTVRGGEYYVWSSLRTVTQR